MRIIKSTLVVCILILTFVQTSFSQSTENPTLDIFVEAYEKNKPLKEVEYSLSGESGKLIQLTSKKGDFGFVIKPNDGIFTLTISKEGYVTKKIHFDSKSYPYTTVYESQEIIVECIPVGAGTDEMVYAGTLKYDPLSNAYLVNKADTMNERLTASLEDKSQRLEKAYDKAVYNGDGLMQIEEYEYAKGYYQIALVTKPEDEYASGKLADANRLAEEQKKNPALVASASKSTPAEQSAPIQSQKVDSAQPKTDNSAQPVKLTKVNSPVGEYYSVQLGAFVDWFDEKAFSNVSDLIVVQGSDYKRCIAGEFTSRDEALTRMNELKDSGFKDAFIITMKGNERIGF